MISEKYKDRLQEWIKGECIRLGKLEKLEKPLSYSQLELRIALKVGDRIDRATLINWANRNYTREITGEPLARLAAYRGESIDQCRRWLEGKSEKTEKKGASDEDVELWIQNCTDPVKLARFGAKSNQQIQLLLESMAPIKE